MRPIHILVFSGTVLWLGCGEALYKMMERTNTVTVKNWSGADIPKIVVLEGRIHHTFPNMQNSSESSHMFPVRKPTMERFTITVSFLDGTSVTTNADISFDPQNLTDTSIVVGTNRLVNISQKKK